MKKALLIISISVCAIYNAQYEQELKSLSSKHNSEYEKQVNKFVSMFPDTPDFEAKSLAGFDSEGKALFITIDNKQCATATNADVVANTTINGETITLTGNGVEVYVWDGGSIRATHQEFGTRVTNQETSAISDHATHVTGTILASGVDANAKGMAPAATVKGYDFNNYLAEIGAASAAKISNHSYGVSQSWTYRNAGDAGGYFPFTGWYFMGNYSVSSAQANTNGYYNDLAQSWDQVAYLQPNHIQVKSAGNNKGDGPSGVASGSYYYGASGWTQITGAVPANDCSTGYDCLNPQANAKNLLILGASQQIAITPSNLQGRYVNPSSVVAASFSAIGPRDDGAIKPDVTAIGTSVYSSVGTSNTSYSSYNGTSMSSPNTTGVLALIQQLHVAKRGATMRSDMAKAIITHSANEAGTNAGPDAVFGWGIIDALKAATLLVMRNNTVYLEDKTLTNGETYEYSFTASGSEPVKATICWLDPAAAPVSEASSLNNRTSRLVNDLDVKVVKISDNSQTMPWKLNPNSPSAAATKGDNTVDNVEQVLIDAPTADAMYKVVVTHKGTLVNHTGSATPSNYALIVSGIKQGTLSVSDIDFDLQNSISIYPNPATDYIKIIANDIEIKDISVFDATGKMVRYTNKVEDNTLNISQLEKGSYIVMMQTEKGTVSKPFIKK